MSDFDMKLTCVDCGREFDFPVEEQRYFMRNGFSMPKRCRDCRTASDPKMPASVIAAALAAQQKAEEKRQLQELEAQAMEAQMEAQAMAKAMAQAQKMQAASNLAEPEPAGAETAAKNVAPAAAEPMAEPVAKSNAEPMAEPIAEPAAKPVAKPMEEPVSDFKDTFSFEIAPQVDYYLVVDGNKYVSIDNVKKMVNIRADMRDIFSKEEAEDWQSFLADKGVIAEMKEFIR